MAQLAADERVTLLDKLDQYVFMWGPLSWLATYNFKGTEQVRDQSLQL